MYEVNALDEGADNMKKKIILTGDRPTEDYI